MALKFDFLSTEVYAAATASISGATNVNLSTSPTTSGIISTGSMSFSYSIADAESFIITLSSDSADTNLSTTATGITNTVSSITTDTILDNFVANTWGYCVNAIVCANTETFSPIKASTSADTIASSTDLSAEGWAANETLFLTFGAKTDLNMPPATYSNTQVISLIAEDYIITSREFPNISYMQEMTPAACAGITTPGAEETDTVPTKQLIDRRDGKKYWVAKLADGNCWMTQNLALDLDASVTLTPDDTDITANWIPAISTGTILRTNNTSTTDPQSFTVGEYVVNAPNATNNLCTRWVADLTACSGFTSITNVGSGTGYTGDFVATGSGKTIEAVDYINLKYDAHYLLGNYYTYGAATATTGTGVNSNGAEVEGSICPKGWKLPIGNITSESGSFSYLLNTAYGLANNASGTVATGGSPLYFSRAGYTGPRTSGGIANVGANGYYWSRNVYSAGSGINLDITPNGISIRSYQSRYRGASIRCIAS